MKKRQDTIAEKALARVQRAGVVRARDLAREGVSPTHLQRLYEQGLLVRSGRGIYLPAELDGNTLDENGSLVEVTLRVPAAVICLLSALQFHGLTTQLPHEVWIALPTRAHNPIVDYPPVRVFKLSGLIYSEGIQTTVINDVPVRVYSPAKTVVDCFKFRNKVGIDVALEALQDSWRKRRVTMDELSHFARICRVEKVMRPYLEAITI